VCVVFGCFGWCLFVVCFFWFCARCWLYFLSVCAALRCGGGSCFFGVVGSIVCVCLAVVCSLVGGGFGLFLWVGGGVGGGVVWGCLGVVLFGWALLLVGFCLVVFCCVRFAKAGVAVCVFTEGFVGGGDL
ncbi:hypothetical protein, partial [Neisseria sp. P0019.S002]|uniref:hypothetical protein n=1 Tax=Neisseria sp. P0019.S002 TaxID=3436798 RepID=UPI003F7D36FE